MASFSSLRPVRVRGAIKLGQFLKLAGLVEDGGLTWLIVGRLGCWGLVVGGIVRVAWVEVRTNVGV